MKLVRPFPARPAWAHSSSESYVYIRPDGTAISGSMQMTIASLAKALDSGLSGEADRNDLEERRTEIQDLYQRCFQLSEDGKPLEVDFRRLRIVETAAGRFCSADWLARTEKPLPRTLTLSIDGLLQVDHHQAVVAMVRYDIGWGKFGYHHRDEHRLDHHSSTHEFTVTEPTFGDKLSKTLQGIVRRSKNRTSVPDRG